MTIIKPNSQKNQLRMLLVVLVAASSLFLAGSTVNIIGQTSQQQYAFAQENTTSVSSYNKTSTNATFFPQIHNYTSSIVLFF